MTIAEEIAREMGDLWLPSIYANKVRPLRTRSYEFEIPLKENNATIQHTLLGIELKVGKVRMSCPDLSTARYLRVFARIGANKVAVPYDISLIPGLADELESSWQRMLLIINRATRGKSQSTRSTVRALLVKAAREEVAKIGAGARMPLFDRETRQKR